MKKILSLEPGFSFEPMLFTYPLWELSSRERSTSTEAFQLSEPWAPIQPHCLSLPGLSYITHAHTWPWPSSDIWRLILTTATLLPTPRYQLVLRLPHQIYAVFLKHLVPFSLLSSNTPPPLHPSLSSPRPDLPDKMIRHKMPSSIWISEKQQKKSACICPV